MPPEPYPIEFLVVAEAPGPIEIEEGRTLIGPSGRELKGALRDAGLDPERASYTNTILCRPPGGDLVDYLRKLKRQAKRDKEIDSGFVDQLTPDEALLAPEDPAAVDASFRLGGSANLSPIDCCRPRLQREMKRTRYAILMGAASLAGVNLPAKIMKLRGTPVQVPDGPPAMPVPHAAFVLRDGARTYRPVFRADVAKAVRIAYQGTTWRDPSYFVASSAQQLANFLGVQRDFTACDTETVGRNPDDGIDPWTCKLRRIGFGTTQEVAIYAPLSVRGHALLAPHEDEAQKNVIREFFRRSPRLGFHNYYGFDSVVLHQHGLPVDDNGVFDSLLGHHIGWTSELPHGLDFLGSTYTDAPHWKDTFKHSSVKDDATLDRYLSFDIAVTHQAGPQVWRGLEVTGQTQVYQLDDYLSRVGRSMAGLGVVVDRAKQWEFASEYQEKADRLRGEFVQACGREVNPRSPQQIVKLLYRDLGLPIVALTGTGEPSSNESALLELLGMGVDRRAEKIIHTLLGFREADKILGTYTGRIEDGKLVGGPPLHLDGRLRVAWKVYGTGSGRWSSGDPMNLQNVIKKLRAMFVPGPGNVYVGADFSAIELRILALVAGDELLIEAFRLFDEGKGPDIHNVNTCTIFKCRSDQVTDEARTFAKRFVYGLSYGAGVNKIHQTLSLLRDDNLQPVFPNITLSEVQRVNDVWWKEHPAIANYQKALVKGWRRTGFIATPWHGRKRYFIGGENVQEMKNHPIQGGAADLQNQAVKTLVEAFPFDYVQHHGLAFQVHDQNVVECREADAERVKRIVEDSMQRKIGPMLFPAKSKAGKTWKEVS